MTDDPVLARRAHIARWVGLGQRVGYGLFGVAIVGFFAGFILEFRPGLVSLIVATMVVGSLILAPAIVFGYGIKAAEREDAERRLPRGSSGEDEARSQTIEQDLEREEEHGGSA